MPAPKNATLVQAWVPRELAAQLRERATQSDRSLSAEVRRAVRSYLNDEDPAGQRGPVTTPVGVDDGYDRL